MFYSPLSYAKTNAEIMWLACGRHDVHHASGMWLACVCHVIDMQLLCEWYAIFKRLLPCLILKKFKVVYLTLKYLYSL
jgi:hypothetical protein